MLKLTNVRDLLMRASDKRLKTLSLVGRWRLFERVCGEDDIELIVLFPKFDTTFGAAWLHVLMDGGCGEWLMRCDVWISFPLVSIAFWDSSELRELSVVLEGVGTLPFKWELPPSGIICWGRDAMVGCSRVEDWWALSLLGDRSMLLFGDEKIGNLNFICSISKAQTANYSGTVVCSISRSR